MSDPGAQRQDSRAEDGAIADQAIALARPLIERLIEDQAVSHDRALHVVVLDPDASPKASFEDAVLASYDFGRSGRCEVDYAMYARNKARASREGRADTSTLREQMTGLAHDGEPPLIGGVHRAGWTIGVSGAQPWVDEAVANILIDLMRALALQRLMTDR